MIAAVRNLLASDILKNNLEILNLTEVVQDEVPTISCASKYKKLLIEAAGTIIYNDDKSIVLESLALALHLRISSLLKQCFMELLVNSSVETMTFEEIQKALERALLKEAFMDTFG